MKKAYFLAVLLGVAAWVDADAQVTQRFPNVVAFGTNVYLHDAPTVPLHERVPTGTVVVALTSTNGSVTINDLGSGNIDLAAASGNFAVNGQNITGRWFASGNTYSGLLSTVLAGTGNVAVGDIALVGSGFNNTASGDGATILNASRSQAFGLTALIGAGIFNHASNDYAVIVGGLGNTNTGLRSFLGGGQLNLLTGNRATISGGYLNIADGTHATIPGGFNNAATTNAFAAGTGGRATNSGSFVWSGPGDTNATFGSRGDNTFNVRSVGGVYFLAPSFDIQDTNGVSLMRVTPTNVQFSGLTQILTVPIANTNYWRRTTAVPTNSAFAGTDGQRTLVWLSSTHAVERVYSGVSNLWLQSGTFYTFP